jgi:hypothetical protein
LSPDVHAVSALHRMTPDGSAAQRAEQQSADESHVSPSGRHPWMSAHVRMPSPCSSAQTRPQQSASVAQASPAGRQPAPAAMHALFMHLFEQQSFERAQNAPVCAHFVAAQISG